jgi:hypothetical protein
MPTGNAGVTALAAAGGTPLQCNVQGCWLRHDAAGKHAVPLQLCIPVIHIRLMWASARQDKKTSELMGHLPMLVIRCCGWAVEQALCQGHVLPAVLHCAGWLCTARVAGLSSCTMAKCTQHLATVQAAWKQPARRWGSVIGRDEDSQCMLIFR